MTVPGQPIPISDADAAYVLRQIQEGIERPKPFVSFEVGEQVRVSDGVGWPGRQLTGGGPWCQSA
jgi:transcription antitermination factor NusG